MLLHFVFRKQKKEEKKVENQKRSTKRRTEPRGGGRRWQAIKEPEWNSWLQLCKCWNKISSTTSKAPRQYLGGHSPRKIHGRSYAGAGKFWSSQFQAPLRWWLDGHNPREIQNCGYAGHQLIQDDCRTQCHGGQLGDHGPGLKSWMAGF